MRHMRSAAGPQPSRPSRLYAVEPYGVHVRNTSGSERDTWATLVSTTREAAGLSKVELARRLGVDRATVSRWEQGLNRPEDAEVVQRFADLLAVDLEQALAAAGLRPSRAPRPAEPVPTDPDVLKLYRLMADPDTPEDVKEQIRVMMRVLADMADRLPPKKARPRKATG